VDRSRRVPMNGFIATHLNKHTNTGPHCRPKLKEMKPTNTKASTGYLILRTTITNQPLSIHFNHSGILNCPFNGSKKWFRCCNVIGQSDLRLEESCRPECCSEEFSHMS